MFILKHVQQKRSLLKNDLASKLFKLEGSEKKLYSKEQDLEFYSSVATKFNSEKNPNRAQFILQCKLTFCLLHSVNWH